MTSFHFALVFALLAVILLLPMGNLTAARLQKAPLMRINHVALRRVALSGDMRKFMGPILDPLLRVRVPDTPGSAAVRRFIKTFLAERTAGWKVEEDKFVSWTPHGPKTFSNIVATLDPRSPRRLVLACHYDSKFFEHGKFVGATDSAVPCAMLLDLVRIFDAALSHQAMRDVTLQLLFFDGEEAFKSWSATDSLYGSRHLAAKMHKRPHPAPDLGRPHLTEIDSIETFVLLDLIGAPQPTFYDHFHSTSYLYRELQLIEHQLGLMGLLRGRRRFTNYFPGRGPHDMLVEDDHLPFLHRGVPVLHLIATPFPKVWHTVEDGKAHLDRDTIDDLNRILRIFVKKYLHLQL